MVVGGIMRGIGCTYEMLERQGLNRCRTRIVAKDVVDGSEEAIHERGGCEVFWKLLGGHGALREVKLTTQRIDDLRSSRHILRLPFCPLQAQSVLNLVR